MNANDVGYVSKDAGYVSEDDYSSVFFLWTPWDCELDTFPAELLCVLLLYILPCPALSVFCALDYGRRKLNT